MLMPNKFYAMQNKREKKTQLDTFNQILKDLYCYDSKSGVSISWNTAMQVSAMLAVSKVIIEGIAQVPFKLFQAQNGQRRPATEHPLYRLLHDEPNDYQTSYEFREQIGLHLVYCGNSFVFINRVGGGKIVELLPFEPGWVTIKRDAWDVYYEIRIEGKDLLTIQPENMWHIKAASWNGVQGLDSVKLIREALGLSLATEEHGARIFSNGARPGGIISTDASPGVEKIKEMKTFYEDNYAGNANAFKTLILWGGMKWAAMASPNDQAQFLETRKFQIEEICRAFLVQPVMVGQEGTSAAYASVEQRFLSHVVYTLSPWYQRIEQSANKSLLSEDEKTDGYYSKFIAAGLMRGAATDRANYFSKALGSGGSQAWMTPDEVRELDELNPMGGEAAKLPMPNNANIGKINTTPDNQNAGQ